MRAKETPGIAPAFYVDRLAFTKLFADVAGNLDRIRLGIFAIAQGLARRYRNYPATWADDAASEALGVGIGCMEEFGRLYRRGRECDAYSYFTKVCQTELRNQLNQEVCRSMGKSPFAFKVEQKRRRDLAKQLSSEASMEASDVSDVLIGHLRSKGIDEYRRICQEHRRAVKTAQLLESRIKLLAVMLKEMKMDVPEREPIGLYSPAKVEELSKAWGVVFKSMGVGMGGVGMGSAVTSKGAP